MKKLLLVGLFTLGFLYANEAQVELEHATKTASSAEGVTEDMSAMKAAGKCNADQDGKAKSKATKVETKNSSSATELEHAVKSPTSPEGTKKDMSAMKAAGKCNSGK